MRMRSELIALFLQFLEGSSTKNSCLPATLLARYSQNLFTLIFSVLYVISNNNVLKMTFEMYVFLVAPHFARGQSRSRKRTPMLWVHTPVYTHTHTHPHTHARVVIVFICICIGTVRSVSNYLSVYLQIINVIKDAMKTYFHGIVSKTTSTTRKLMLSSPVPGPSSAWLWAFAKHGMNPNIHTCIFNDFHIMVDLSLFTVPIYFFHYILVQNRTTIIFKIENTSPGRPTGHVPWGHSGLPGGVPWGPFWSSRGRLQSREK
jgi:hypothetical protein